MAKQIKFTVGGFFGGYKTVEVTIAGGAASYKILRNGLLNVDKKISAAVKVSAAWIDDLDALKIFAWQENYSSDVRDGTQWELTFKDGDKIYHGHGSNAYPKNWEQFLDWLDALIPEMEFVCRTRLEKVTLDYSRESAIGYTVTEKLTLDRRAKTLKLDKHNSSHRYDFGADIDKLFDAAQEFFDNLERDDLRKDSPAKIKIELVRHDGSIENIDSTYTERNLPGLTQFVNAVKGFVTDLTAEMFKPVPEDDAPAQGKYILCKVQFKGSYKHYTYQTDDETLAVGDTVDVPVGKFNDVNQARIVEIGYFDEYETPFPVDRIKKIIGKHVASAWDNY